MAFYPTKVVADKLGYTPQHVRRLIKAGTLNAVWDTYEGRFQQLVEWLDGLEEVMGKGTKRDKTANVVWVRPHDIYFTEWRTWMEEGFLLSAGGRRFSNETINDYAGALTLFFKLYKGISTDTLLKAWQTLTKSRRYMLYFAILCYARFLVMKKIEGPILLDELKQFKPERKRDVKRTVLEEDEAQKIFDFLQNNREYGQERSILNRAIVATMYFAGLRNSELCGLLLEDVDLDSPEKTMTFVRKGGERQTLGIPSSLVPFLKEYLKIRPTTEDPHFFVGQNRKGFTRAKIQQKVKRVGKHLGLDITPHGLRRSFVTISLKKGRPLSEVSKAAGHKHLTTTELYNMTSERQVVRSMQNW